MEIIMDKILCGDSREVLKSIPDGIVQTCVTSPPYYGLRDYGVENQIGLEETPEEYVENLVILFREVKRVLRNDGTLWLNLGDSYWGGKGQSSQAWSTEHQDRNTLQKSQHQISGKGQTRPTDRKHPSIKSKDLIGIPWMVAFALRADGWYLRSDIIWSKPNPMPESVKDRPTKSHEYIFLLSKSQKYYYDAEAIQELANYDGRKDERMHGAAKYNKEIVPGDQVQSMARDGHDRWKKNQEGERVRNKRTVWTVETQPYSGAHFATYPRKLIIPCILAGSKRGDIVLDPFGGAGTTAKTSIELGRHFITIELNKTYVDDIIKPRILSTNPALF